MSTKFTEALIAAYKKIPSKNHPRIDKFLFHNATLEEASAAYPGAEKITRERVRQLKNKFMSVIFSSLDKDWSKSIEQYCYDHNKGIPIESLSLIDPFFEGIEIHFKNNPTNFINELFIDTRLKLDIYKDSFILVLTESISGSDLVNQILKEYLSTLHEKLTFKENVKLFCKIEGREDIFEEIFNDVLIKAKSNKQKLAKICSDELFALGHDYIDPHLVLKHSIENFGEVFDGSHDGMRSLEAVISRIPGLNLISKHRYSKYENFPKFLKHDEVKLISIIEEIINSKPDRQWHLKNVVQLIIEDPKYYSSLSDHCIERLDHVSVNFILKHFLGVKHSLKYLRMYVWSLQDSTTNTRADINSLAYEIIEENGSPMTIGEIKTKIMETRGIRSTTQIHVNETTPDVLPVAREVYGIRNRDFTITIEDEERMFTLLRDAIETKDFILGEDFKLILENERIKTQMNDYQLGRFLKRGVKNRSVDGQYWMKVNKSKFAIINTKTLKEDIPDLKE